jgi:hypothetical protein
MTPCTKIIKNFYSQLSCSMLHTIAHTGSPMPVSPTSDSHERFGVLSFSLTVLYNASLLATIYSNMKFWLLLFDDNPIPILIVVPGAIF